MTPEEIAALEEEIDRDSKLMRELALISSRAKAAREQEKEERAGLTATERVTMK